MTNRTCLLLSLTLFTLLPAQVYSQSDSLRKKNIQQTSSVGPQTNAQSLKLLNDIEARLKGVNQPAAHQPPVSGQTSAFIIVGDTVRDVTFNRAPNGMHFLLTRLILVNQGPEPLKLIRSQIKAMVDGQQFPLRALPANLSNQVVQLGKRSQRLSSLSFQDQVTVPPGEQDSLWILLTDLPGAPRIPEIEFQVTVDNQTLKLNVNHFELGKLRYEVKLLGPSECLAELTVSGEINT
ncbi:MAG: hypothetical protein KDA74_05350, partial [Planctomycetaceae bacterium]|nr:hypothetical protein [Planctomycetaceae bacterium]